MSKFFIMKSNLSFYEDDSFGFLPDSMPQKVTFLKNKVTELINEISISIPKLLLTKKIRPVIDSLHKNDLSVSGFFSDLNEEDIKVLNRQFSFISHAYIYGDRTPFDVLPSVLSEPWVNLSNYLGRPPVLSYSSYCLDNWFKIDDKELISLENVALINNFLGGIDEDWFVTIHVCIEDAASSGLNSAMVISKMFKNNNVEKALVIEELKKIKKSLFKVNEIFKRMPEKCDPYIYYHRVRPYIFGSKNNPDLPNGLVYENCYNDKAQFFRGETGAQSSMIPSFDALFNVKHERDELRNYLDEMRSYMPPSHLKFIAFIELHSKLSELVSSSAQMKALTNDCLEEIRIFRTQHLQFAADYIHKQSIKQNPFGSGGSTERGTGGTPFMKYLKKHRDETVKIKN